MVLECYCNLNTILRLELCGFGPLIFSSYGLFVGFGGLIYYYVTKMFLDAFVDTELLMPATFDHSLLACAGPVVAVIGWRMCSMLLEDMHEVRSGNILRAFLRPGYLEAGGHSFLMIFSLLQGLGWGVRLSQDGVKHAVLLSDAFNAGYYLFLASLKLGCVVYGCCWGITMEQPRWYSTYYHSSNSKCIRTRPDLMNKPLFPISTMMAALFVKNSVICFVYAYYLPYVPGTFTAILPWVNRLDKNLYFPYRGDGANTGYVPGENFYMVEPTVKKAHCIKWALPSMLNGYLALAYVAYSVLVLRQHCSIDLGLNVDIISTHATLSFVFPATCFGFFYKHYGLWLPSKTRNDLVEKKSH